jgi:ADP-heptose:LPS heptosyltransferase
LTTPGLALLKRERPDLQLGVAVEKPFASVFEGSPLVTKVLAPEWRAVRRWRPDLCVNLHGGALSQWMTGLSGAKWRAGFAHHNLTVAYNLRIGGARQILGVQRTIHAAEQLASAFFALGVPVQDVPRAQLAAAQSPARGRYAVLHPFASAPEKLWTPERFCELARYLQLWNIRPIFLAGPGEDATPFSAHQIWQGSLAEAKALISGAVLFVGNDSGPAQIAAAFGVPSVVLFGASNPSVWGPWKTGAEIVLDPSGLRQVTVSRVIAAIERLQTLEKAHA